MYLGEYKGWLFGSWVGTTGYWVGVSKKIGAAAGCDGESVALAFDKGSTAQQRKCYGSPKTLSCVAQQRGCYGSSKILSCARENCCTARKPPLPHKYCHYFGDQTRGKIEFEHVKEDVGEWEC